MTLLQEIWGVLAPRHRQYVLVLQLVSLLMAFATVTGVAAIAPFFAVLGDPRLIERNELLRWLYVQGGSPDRRSFEIALGFGFITVVAAVNLVNALGSMVTNHLALRIGTQLQTTLYSEYLRRPYAFHASTNSLTLLNNVIQETGRVTNGILQNAFVLVTNAITGLFILLSIALVRPMVAAATVVALAGGYGLIYFGVRNRLLQLGYVQSRSAIEQARIVSESLGAIKEITVLNAQDFFRRQFELASESFGRATARVQVVGQTPRYIMECVAAMGLVGLALALGGRAGGVGSSLGQLTFLAFAAYRLLPTLQQVFAAVVRIRADRAGLARIAPDLLRARARQLETSARSAGAERSQAGPSWTGLPRQEIRICNVSFRHVAHGPWVLDRVSLRIPAHGIVGIVGANGSGKTTLLDLIAGLLVPVAGRIEVDGLALDDQNRSSWQSQVAYVPQSLFLLDSSIEQNIALGLPTERIDRPRLLEAARLAQLDDLIAKLSQGYQQRVGERGVALSGGQRQRIGIARALYTQAQVLLLDEATSALDGLTEQELMVTLGRLRGRCTSILIAHRMSTARSCDMLFELDQGRVVESGTYDALMKSSAAFRRLAGVC